MKTVAIISEYNPFHTGHEYQLGRIREEFGQDTRIIAIMSGNFTQRGETAITDKTTRAECAVKGGVDLVLELPFPHSSSSAEFFARGGVSIANSLGVVDVLSFGSESGDIEEIVTIAKAMISSKYTEKIAELSADPDFNSFGYPRLCEMAYCELFLEELNYDFSSSNNILALEYVKALILENSSITPHTIKRCGADYNEKKIVDSIHQSASAIRSASIRSPISALDYIPLSSKSVISSAINSGAYPCDMEKLSTAIISHFRLNPPSAEQAIHDAGGGLYNRIYNNSFKTNSINELIKLTDTKKYTSARVRRAILNSFLGVTSSMVKNPPLYTQVLAMNGVGKSILKEIKKKSAISVITKPTSYDGLSTGAKIQKNFSDRADFIFQLTKPAFFMGATALKTTPFVAD